VHVAKPALTFPEGEPLDPFIPWLLARSGLEAPAYRPGFLQRRLPACLRRLRVSSGAEARALVERRPEMRESALSTLLIGVSDFFRDPPVFDFLRQSTLPSLLSARSGLRVCSLGVSHGQELYSVAMLLAEFSALERSALLGVDCRQDAIAHAAVGRFDERELSGLEEHLRERYFIAEGSRWRIRAELRDRISWRTGDAFSLAQEEFWDVILFRNVAIYLETEAHAPLWRQIGKQLADGGVLVTGKAEQPPASAGLRRITPCIYQRAS
jgi:chemotaxis methyl-accepting protein methylase